MLFKNKHMKFWNSAQLCLAISDFEAQIMLNKMCLDYHVIRSIAM